MSGSLNGKVAVVTGAGRGVGRAYALALVGEGASVVVNDLPARDGSHSNAEQVVAEIVAAGGRGVANHGSVSDFAAAEGMVAAAVEQFGRLDILVANAGNTKPVSLLESSASDWADVVAVHLNGTFNCIHHAATRMMQSGGGTIITTGDLQTDLIFPGLGAYRSSKGAIAVLTLQAAWELRRHNINVNSIMPWLTASAMSETYMGSLRAERSSFAERTRLRYGAAEVGVVKGPVPPETGSTCVRPPHVRSRPPLPDERWYDDPVGRPAQRNTGPHSGRRQRRSWPRRFPAWWPRHRLLRPPDLNRQRRFDDGRCCFRSGVSAVAGTRTAVTRAVWEAAKARPLKPLPASRSCGAGRRRAERWRPRARSQRRARWPRRGRSGCPGPFSRPGRSRRTIRRGRRRGPNRAARPMPRPVQPSGPRTRDGCFTGSALVSTCWPPSSGARAASVPGIARTRPAQP
jgi:NAD(P)-dependent dehydrogenase (short-subunit alcohol dehydrogenase family)